MHLRRGRLHRAQDVAIIERRQIARQAALNADLGCAPAFGFAALVREFVEREEVGSFVARPDAEGAKLAADKTDVSEINIARDDVADDVADQPSPQLVSRDHHAEKIVSVGIG